MVGKDAKGRFTKGNQYGKKSNGGGRKSKQVEQKYLDAIKSAVTVDDLVRIFDVGLARAKAGDIAWARLILDYTVGPPVKRIEADINTIADITLVWPENDDTND